MFLALKKADGRTNFNNHQINIDYKLRVIELMPKCQIDILKKNRTSLGRERSGAKGAGRKERGERSGAKGAGRKERGERSMKAFVPKYLLLALILAKIKKFCIKLKHFLYARSFLINGENSLR